MKCAHSLLRCGWGWVGHSLCLLWVGITYVCFIRRRLPVFAVEPQYRLQDFLSKVSLEGHIQNLQKNSCWCKIWMGFVGSILIKLWTSSFWGFLEMPVWWPLGTYLCKYAGDHSVVIVEAGACSSLQLTCLGLYGMAAWKLNETIFAMIKNCSCNDYAHSIVIFRRKSYWDVNFQWYK